MSPKAGGGGVAGSQPMSTTAHRNPNKLRRSNSILNQPMVSAVMISEWVGGRGDLRLCGGGEVSGSGWLGGGGGISREVTRRQTYNQKEKPLKGLVIT
jgi:hypothetical protein